MIVMLSRTSSSVPKYSSATSGVSASAVYDASNSVLSTGDVISRTQYKRAADSGWTTVSGSRTASPGDLSTPPRVYTPNSATAFWRVYAYASGYVDSGNASVKI